MEEQALIIQQNTGLSLFDAPVDERWLQREWGKARERFLFHILTRKGMDAENLRHNTQENYRVAINQFFDGMYDASGIVLWPMIDPWRVTPALVGEYVQIMGLVGKSVRTHGPNGPEVGRAGLAASTIDLKLAGLKLFYDYVQNQHEIPYNPTAHDGFIQAEMLFLTENKRSVILWSPAWRNPFDAKAVERLPVAPFGKAVYPTTEEFKNILSCINTLTVTGKRDYALLVTLYSTACRASEVLNLKWGDLQEKPNGNFTFRFRGKNGKINEVEMQRRTFFIIQQYLQAAGRLETMQATDFIFTALDGERVRRLPGGKDRELVENQPISNSLANRIFKKYGRVAGVDKKKCHLHGMRHARANQTAEDMAQKTGAIDVVQISKMLRHSNLGVTQTYIDSVMKKAEDPWAGAALDAVLPTGERRARKRKAAAEQLPLDGVGSKE